MKKGGIFTIVILVILIVISSCDPILNFFDEDPNNGNQNNEQIRIKRIDYYQQDTINLSEYYEFFYNSDNEVNLINRYNNYVNPDSMKLYNSSTFNKSSDTITEHVTFQNEIASRQVYIVQNNNLVKSEEYYKKSDGEWFHEGYLVYEYSSNKLISNSSWDNINGTMELSGEKKYTYIDNLVSSYDDFGFYWQASTQSSEYKKLHMSIFITVTMF